jgi:hypothetical protein
MRIFRIGACCGVLRHDFVTCRLHFVFDMLEGFAR